MIILVLLRWQGAVCVNVVPAKIAFVMVKLSVVRRAGL